MQTNKVDLYLTATSNINEETFSIVYDNSLILSVRGTYRPIGLVSILLYLDQYDQS